MNVKKLYLLSYSIALRTLYIFNSSITGSSDLWTSFLLTVVKVGSVIWMITYYCLDKINASINMEVFMSSMISQSCRKLITSL